MKKRSLAPLAITALVWVLCGLLLPMYKLSSWFLGLVAASVTWVLTRKKFCPKEEPELSETPEPESVPSESGDAKIDALLQEGRRASGEMEQLRKSIANPALDGKIAEIADLTKRIFEDLLEDPADYEQVKRFSNYFLPTTLKLLNAYDRCCAQSISGENIDSTKKRIENVLDETAKAYRKQLDSLFANQSLDIETDITVLQTMLKREGLAGNDFGV